MNNHPVILCVDDEQLSLTIRKMVLEQQGYQVLAATGVDQAMMLCASNPVDLVLSDYYLEGNTGIDLARKLKKKQPDLMIAILSGAAEIPEGIENADAFISKTISPQEMLSEVAHLLERTKRDGRRAA